MIVHILVTLCAPPLPAEEEVVNLFINFVRVAFLLGILRSLEQNLNQSSGHKFYAS